jgi:hypothetical protein
MKKSTKYIYLGIGVFFMSTVLYFTLRGKEKSKYEKS